ncbi:MAG TPA: nuclear transport factor 2 family protein [Pseudonocardiaceae bacterium]|jgi:ketosteroid isomerase-like protein|nr:nuclear transport factor 2 family protein [Pseudonocardiaceae bacterium]
MSTPTEFLTDWTNAEVNGDEAAVTKALTDDFTCIGPLGFSLSKEDWMKRHSADSKLKYTALELSELSTRTYGDVAIVIGRQEQQATFNGQPIPSTLRASFVLVAQGEDWQLANIQFSFVAGTPGAPPVPGRPA